jgi:type I restriction enzyme S subunit
MPLGDLCSLIVDSEHKTAPKAPDGEFPLIRTSDLGVARVDYRSAQRVDTDTYAAWTKRAAPHEGDLLLAREAPVGGVGLVPAGVHPVLGQRTVLLRPDPDVSDSRFLLYRLAAPDMHGRMQELATGATVPHLNMSDIRQLSVGIPGSTAKQERIGRVLAAFDELVEINERRIELLEDLTRSLYREWFVRFRFPGHETVEIVDSELGPIPETWTVHPLAHVAGARAQGISSGPFGSKLGRKDYRDFGVPVIRGSNLAVGGRFVDEGFVFVEEAKADELRSSIARSGDIVITQRGTLGQAGLVPRQSSFDRYVISQSQMKITVEPERASARYVYALMRSDSTTQRILNMAISTGVPHINLTMLREMPIVYPPIELQRRFDESVSPMADLIEDNEAEARALARTRDLLLPRLVTGHLDISDVDLGGLLPAEVA